MKATFKRGFPNAFYTNSPKSWQNSETFSQYLVWFNENTDSTSARLLILDGASSHLSYPNVKYCDDNNIIVLKLPPNITHVLQPLDVSVMGPLKKYWSNEVSKPTCKITNCTFSSYLKIIWPKIESVGILNGFRTTGNRIKIFEFLKFILFIY